MSTIQWDESYSIGISKIDEQHKELLALLNQANLLAEISENSDELRELVLNMTRYAYYHFQTEEELMNAYDYPDKKLHKEMHTAFKQQADGYLSDIVNGNGDALVIIHFLSEWLSGHVRGSDKKLGRFLNGLNIH